MVYGDRVVPRRRRPSHLRSCPEYVERAVDGYLRHALPGDQPQLAAGAVEALYGREDPHALGVDELVADLALRHHRVAYVALGVVVCGGHPRVPQEGEQVGGGPRQGGGELVVAVRGHHVHDAPLKLQAGGLVGAAHAGRLGRRALGPAEYPQQPAVQLQVAGPVALVGVYVRGLGVPEYVRPAPLQRLEVCQVWGVPVGGDRDVQQVRHVFGDDGPGPGGHGQDEGRPVAAHHPDVPALAVHRVGRLVYPQESGLLQLIQYEAPGGAQQVGGGAAGVPYGGLAGRELEHVPEYLGDVRVDALLSPQPYHDAQRLPAEGGAGHAGEAGPAVLPAGPAGVLVPYVGGGLHVHAVAVKVVAQAGQGAAPPEAPPHPAAGAPIQHVPHLLARPVGVAASGVPGCGAAARRVRRGVGGRASGQLGGQLGLHPFDVVVDVGPVLGVGVLSGCVVVGVPPPQVVPLLHRPVPLHRSLGQPGGHPGHLRPELLQFGRQARRRVAVRPAEAGRHLRPDPGHLGGTVCPDGTQGVPQYLV